MLYAYLETYGFQMNSADSDMLSGLLQSRGYEIVETADDADLVVVNTCSVRQHAEDKAKGRITEFCGRKKRHAGQQIWVIGCMAERMGDELKKQLPGIDRVIGAPMMEQMPELIDGFLADQIHGDMTDSRPRSGISAFLPVMRGCDNFCTYCIVPHVRGREHSIPADQIIDSARKLIDSGTLEITLLGQNVNSYKDEETGFPQLLYKLHEIEGLKRIRFMTSHPKDLSNDLITAYADLPKLSRHLHLPVQSGSSKILDAMNRHYTREHYLGLIDKVRAAVPDIDITTDVMVGFPGETDEDFEATMEMFREVRYTAAFMFAYSSREGTPAASFKGQVDEAVKKVRLSRLIDMQTLITKEHYASMVGKTVSTLFTERQNKRTGSFIGFDDHFKKVAVVSENNLSGRIELVRVVSTTGMTLAGEIVS